MWKALPFEVIRQSTASQLFLCSQASSVKRLTAFLLNLVVKSCNPEYLLGGGGFL
jgi:hypothetical protein